MPSYDHTDQDQSTTVAEWLTSGRDYGDGPLFSADTLGFDFAPDDVCEMIDGGHYSTGGAPEDDAAFLLCQLYAWRNVLDAGIEAVSRRYNIADPEEG